MKFLFKMITSPRFLLLFIGFAYFNFIHDVKCEKALIFNFKKEQLITPRVMTENGSSLWHEVSFCILACPTPSSNINKNQINDERSITKNGVFSRFIYEKEILMNDIDFCETPFKPTTVLNESTNSIETGYELFYKDGIISSLEYEKYNQLSKVYGKEANKEEVQTDSLKIQKIEEDKKTKFQVVGSNTKWAYFWISVLSIKGAEARRQINFTKDSIQKQSDLDDFSEICKDYALGDDSENVISREKIDRLREIVNRNTDSENPLKITQIMPMRYFHSHSAKLATCTELNLAFIWDNVTIGYMKVDSYLYAVYKAWPTKVNIIFGVKGAIETNFDESTDNSILKNYTMPAPEVFYRIVEYRQEDVILNVVVIFHNDFRAVPKEKRICDVEDEVSSWNEMKINHPTSAPNKLGLAYACRVTPDVITKLQAEYTITENMQPFILTENKRRSIVPGERFMCISMSFMSTDSCTVFNFTQESV